MEQLKLSQKLRVSNVGYLNSAPFRALKKLDFVDYQECEPAECARMLHEDECDLACIPLAEYAVSAEYTAMDVGIVSKGAVQSVFLFAEQEFDSLDTIYLDSASQTSIVLLRLILFEMKSKLRGDIRFIRQDAKLALKQLGKSSGALIIGDLALAHRGKARYELDLAAQWSATTGKPFVFAVWAYRANRISRNFLYEIRETLLEGVSQRSVYARHFADEYAISREIAQEYISKRVSYVIDKEAVNGAEKFLHKSACAGFLPKTQLRIETDFRSNCELTHGASHERSIDSILQDACSGWRISITDGVRLGLSASMADLALAANCRKDQLSTTGGVSYIVERNINYTNICNVYCRFCAFYRAPGKSGGYVLSNEEIAEKIQATVDAGGIQILLQGGLNPELGIEYYEELFRWIKQRWQINLHALSSDEIWHISRVSQISLKETLERLIEAGLGSIPGGGAEILVARIRRRIARLKTSDKEWLEVHRIAHHLGITSSCTMMFGVGETWHDRLVHVNKLRQLQDETGGFSAFITWPFQQASTRLKSGDVSAPEYLRVQAVCRLFLDNIANIQNSWVTQGPSVGQLALFFGANDFGSVMFEENVVSATGVGFSMDANMIERHITEAGFLPWRRDVHYQKVAG